MVLKDLILNKKDGVSTLRYSSLFDVTTTDIPFYDKLLKGKEVSECGVNLTYEIKIMTPHEYLKRCSILHQDRVEDEYKMIIDSRIDSLLEYA